MHRPRKRFGQHFLCDKTIIEHLIMAINPQPGEHFVEIGPGLGALTKSLLPAVGQLEVIEIDRDLIPKLQRACEPLGDLTVYSADALQVDFKALAKGRSLRVVGNLPYNISTPILFHLIGQLDCIKDLCFMLQKEVVDRMVAKPGTKTYGRLSVMLQYFCTLESLFLVPPDAFSPPPKVMSALVRLVPHAVLPCRARKMSVFKRLVLQAFSQRRKTLRRSLKAYVSEADWQSVDIDPKERAENLSVQQFVALANQITQEDQ
jgi:16S rRNA (adenine1518-N6/adenine1519-N6)-dimethyltransferase